MLKKVIALSLLLRFMLNSAQSNVQSPPMGFMTWNYYGVGISEAKIKALADEMASNGLRAAGYNYIVIDDGWQGGRDNTNHIIADPAKFPSGIKALADYVHSKGLKLGIYSDAAPLTCAGYTASLGFEEQDAKTFASWGIDYLKYDYCGAPPDWVTAVSRYEKMNSALKNSGRDILFAICEWGDRKPWHWAPNAGGTMWRTTADIRDKWKSNVPPVKNSDLHGTGAGILDVFNINADLARYAGPGAYNDPDMLLVGLYGAKGPAADLGGAGCTDTEYRSQMSLWCLMASPLMISLDVWKMNTSTKSILLNPKIIAVNQDKLNIQAERIINRDGWQVLRKPLEHGDVAVGVLNTAEETRAITLTAQDLKVLGLGKAEDLWSGKTIKTGQKLSFKVQPHETVVYRFSK